MPSFLDNDQSCNSHLAALVAINIVTQVLDEAEDILNAAHDSGQPWRYIWCQKKGHGEFYENAKILGILDLKVDDNDTSNNEIIQNDDNVIVTSTPQKEIDYIPRTYNENSLIGQGDEDIQMRNTDMRSPSMLINCLFDMSDVEHSETVEIFDDLQVNPDSRDYLANTVAKLVESYVNLALNTVCGEAIIPEPQRPQVLAANIEGSSNSSYSLLTDALVTDNADNENAYFYTERVKSKEDNDQCTTQMVNDEYLEENTNNDIDEYENTFLTLNRDYDKYSEDEEDFVPEEKSLAMQDVELTTNALSENLESFTEPTYILTKPEEPSMPIEGNHKNSLVKRCRLQGAKLMSRLRSWWWKQRLIGKRKGSRSGICPISPKARNLTASLLDHRKLRSPSPTRTMAWKFNTVNEALIHSYNMKDYDFDLNSSDPVEKH